MRKHKHVELMTGHRVHFRRTQMLAWSIAAAVLGAGFIAGLYFGVLQQHWHFDIGSLRWNGFSLKHWWDNLYSSPDWPIYRHSAFRDIPEPSFAVMGVLTLIAKPKYWDKQVSTLRLVTAPFILILATFALGIAGTWLLYFGLPEHVRSVLAHGQLGTLLLGFLIGRLLHKFWAPVGAAYQARILQRSVAKSRRNGRVPAWVRFPLAPPVLRERFSQMWRTFSDEALSAVEEREQSWRRWSLTLMVFGFTLITILGLIAHYWIGKGHAVPYLTS